jgi:hypothetical protein
MTELHALKLYYLFARRRSNQTNMAHLSYDTIEEFTGIERTRIRRAISFLSAIAFRDGYTDREMPAGTHSRCRARTSGWADAPRG